MKSFTPLSDSFLHFPRLHPLSLVSWVAFRFVCVYVCVYKFNQIRLNNILLLSHKRYIKYIVFHPFLPISDIS